MIWRAALLALLVAGSGCLAWTPAPRFPTAGGDPWTSWQGPWVQLSHGCGFCGGTLANASEMFLVALDPEGKVLRVDYAVGGPAAVNFMDDGLEPWRPVVEPLFSSRSQYGQDWQEGRIRVFAVHALALAAADAKDVADLVARALERVRSLPPPEIDCEDCGAAVMQAQGLRVELGSRPAADSGWPELRQQLNLLRAWAAGEPNPTP